MSFVIALCVPKGIVMAADSLSTKFAEKQKGKPQIVDSALTYKLFLTSSRIGIGTFAAADVKGVCIGNYIKSFIDECLVGVERQIDEVPDEILKYFRALPAPPDTGFFIAGYKKAKNVCRPHLWRVSIKQGKERVNSDCCPYAYDVGGEADIFQRLTEQAQIYDKKLGKFKPVRDYGIDWDRLGLEGTIKFATFAVKVTSHFMHFQRRDKTIGGPIDVLVIKPDKARWVKRKGLAGEKEKNP